VTEFWFAAVPAIVSSRVSSDFLLLPRKLLYLRGVWSVQLHRRLVTFLATEICSGYGFGDRLIYVQVIFMLLFW
jgi:hypothetical protein